MPGASTPASPTWLRARPPPPPADGTNTNTGTGGTGGTTGGTGGTTGGTGTTTGSASYPHQPAGYSKITDRLFNAANEDGWKSSSGLTVESDASAPLSPNGVLKVTYPAGFGGGYSPIWSDKNISSLGYRKLYVSFSVKLSSNWQGHKSGTNKIGFLWLDGHPGIFFNARGSGSGTLEPTVSMQGTPQGAANLVPNVGNNPVKRGQWQKWEAVILLNGSGQSNGEIHLWVDGVKVGEYKGLNLTSGGGFETLTWRPIWGGGDDTVQSTQYMWMDHYFASGAR